MSFEKIRQFIIDFKNSTNSTDKAKTLSEAQSYVNSLDSSLVEAAKLNDIDIFASGENFKNYLTSSTGVDESVFTKAYKDLENLDLSGLSVEKQIDSEKEDAGFYSILNKIYSDDTLSQVIDANGDGVISDKEAKDFLNSIKGLDNNDLNISLDDISALVDKAGQSVMDNPFEKMFEGFQDAFSKITQDALDVIENLKQKATNTAPSVSYAPASGSSWSPSSSNSKKASSSASNAQAKEVKTPAQTKEELEEKIEEYNKEISEINAGTHPEVKQAIEDEKAAKEEMEKQIKNDEKINKETKEEFTKVNDDLVKKEEEISACESEISQTESSLTKGENTLSSLKSALSSLAKPTGKEEDKESDKKINERKSSLEKQIKEQEEANKELEEKLEELNDKKEKLEEQKEDLTKKKEELQKEIEKNCSPETKEAIKNYEDKKAAVEEIKAEKLNEVQGELKTAQEELKKVEDEIQTSENKQAESNFSADFDEMLGQVLGYEGGFSDHPNDNGGATNYGITEATYRAYKGDNNADVRNITQEEVKEIYYNNYYKASGADKYAQAGDSAYAFAVFDAAVNHGVGAAQKMDAQAGGDVDKFMEVRKQKYIGIVANNPSQAVFEKGWQNRWNKVYSFIDPNHKYENYIA